MGRSGSRTIQAVIGSVAAVALVAAMVVRTTDAAFTDTTENAGNSWDAGTVTLTDDDAGSAMFTVTDMAPGDSNTSCIEVTYNGSITPSSAVDLYASVSETVVSGDGLGNDLDVTVDIGGAGETCDVALTKTSVYSGTLAAFNTSSSPISTGWTPAPGSDTTRAFEFTATLGSDTPNSAQGEGADATFTWSASS